MKRGVAGIVALALVLIPAGASALIRDAAKYRKAGDELWEKRSRAPAAIREAIAKYEQATAEDPKDAEAPVKIARAYCFMARFDINSYASHELFRRANEYAQKAVENDGKSAAAHYWWAFSRYKSVETKSKFARLSVVGDVTAHLLTANKIDPTVDFGGPDRLLALIALKNPIPEVSIAISSLARSLRIAPGFGGNLLLMAQARIDNKEPEEARALLKRVLELTPEPGFEKELADDQQTAKTLIGGLGQ